MRRSKKFKKYDSSWNFIATGNETRKIFPTPKLLKKLDIKNSEVLQYYKTSEIAVGNSVWDEPLGRIAIEASKENVCQLFQIKVG